MIRIAHFISLSGITSRRKAEQLILNKRVTINGIVEDNLARKINTYDIIRLDGIQLIINKPRLFMLNKPIKYLVSHNPEHNKKTIFDLIRPDIYLTYVGRLDYMSEGLLLLTNSPKIAHHLTTEEFPRRYLVDVNRIDQNFFQFLQNPHIDSYILKRIIINNTRNKTTCIELDITLYEGKNREIRKICALFNMTILRLIRIQYGPFKCNIALGECIEIFDFNSIYLNKKISMF